MHLKVAAAFQAWQEFAAERRQAQEQLRVRLLLYNSSSAARCVLCALVHGYKRALTLAFLMPFVQAAACLWANRAASTALRTWRSHAALAARLRAFVQRWQGSELSAAFLTWRDWAENR